MSDIDRQLLGIYLNDHLAGATAGAALACRSQSAVRSPGMAAALEEVVPQIVEDRATLIAIMRRLGVPVRQYKVAAGRAAELLGRAKPNGRVRTRSPLTDLVELEGLLTGIAGKESLWQTLLSVAEQLGGPIAGELDGLIARAHAQRQALMLARDVVASEAFLPRTRGASASV